MANQAPKNLEKHHESGSEKHQGPEHGDKAKLRQLRETKEGVGEIVDVMPTGEVAEEMREDKKKAGAGGFGGIAAQDPQAVIAKQLKMPSVEIMRKQVAVEIKKQIKLLEHEAHKIMMNPAGFSPFTLNGVVSKIRELKEILGQLAFATVEALKGWWMKFVKNITI